MMIMMMMIFTRKRVPPLISKRDNGTKPDGTDNTRVDQIYVPTKSKQLSVEYILSSRLFSCHIELQLGRERPFGCVML